MRHRNILAVTLLLSSLSLLADSLAPGKAAGTLSIEGKETKLEYAATFVDQQDERKPVILVLSDKELPASKWKTGSDYMMWRMDNKFIGVAFWLDSKREVFRTDYYDADGFPASSSGIFTLKLDAGSGKPLTGSASSTEAAAKLTDAIKLDVKFAAK